MIARKWRKQDSELGERLQVSFVGLTEEGARDVANKGGYGDKVSVVKTSFKANSKVNPLASARGTRLSALCPAQQQGGQSIQGETRKLHCLDADKHRHCIPWTYSLVQNDTWAAWHSAHMLARSSRGTGKAPALCTLLV